MYINNRTCTSLARHWILHCSIYYTVRKRERFREGILFFPIYFRPLLNGESGSGHLIRSFLLLLISSFRSNFPPGTYSLRVGRGGQRGRKNGHTPARSLQWDSQDEEAAPLFLFSSDDKSARHSLHFECSFVCVIGERVCKMRRGKCELASLPCSLVASTDERDEEKDSSSWPPPSPSPMTNTETDWVAVVRRMHNSNIYCGNSEYPLKSRNLLFEQRQPVNEYDSYIFMEQRTQKLTRSAFFPFHNMVKHIRRIMKIAEEEVIPHSVSFYE